MTARNEIAIDAVAHEAEHDGTVMAALSTEMSRSTRRNCAARRRRCARTGREPMRSSSRSKTHGRRRSIDSWRRASIGCGAPARSSSTDGERVHRGGRTPDKRRVRAFVSGIDTAADLRSELVYFEPEQPPSEIGQ
jgi:hypothetical protein